MHVNLSLTDEQKLALEIQATARGIDAESYIQRLVGEGLAAEEEQMCNQGSVPLEQWQGRFRNWIAGHRSRNPRVDDSRESMYS